MSSTTQNTNVTSISISPDREALSLMTKLKLDRFKLRKIKFEEEYTQIMIQKNDLTISLFDKVQMLRKSIERLFAEEGKERYLQNFDALLSISKSNPSTLNNFLENLYEQLMKVIIGGKKRSEYNYLFGLIMSQWLSTQKDEFIPIEIKTTNESLLTNEQLENIIFNRTNLDLNQWHNFLQNKLFFFSDDEQKLKNAFEKFKLATENYGKILLTEKISLNDIYRSIDSLINGGSLDEYRKRLLIKMRLDENIVNEFASSLNLMISDLIDWKWPIEGVRGIFRRNLIGKYRCFYEEDFLTAIFLEYIGLKWSYHFKNELKIFFNQLTEKFRNNCSSNSILYERIKMQRDKYWMASLPDESDNKSGIANYTDMNQSSLKAKLFYLINVEIQLHQVLQPNESFTVISSDFEWFGPSISHEIIQIFLQCCGISQIWIDFFDRFLKQPIYYKPGELIRQRQRGVPISHSLSYLFSELILFGMDFYIYRTTGIFNYRLHDDLWLFHSQSEKIQQAWLLMNEYAQMTGLKFNEEKCGSIQIKASNINNQNIQQLSSNISLPCKDVKWGLLTLQSSGRFAIDRKRLITFLDEMKIRLTNASTIIEWVNLYNQYISFFIHNFGKCTNILGTYHVKQMLETFQFLHQYVFSETNGNALTVLTNRIEQQISSDLIDKICEAWFYWPLIQGGLDLKNIFLTLYGFQDWFAYNKITTFDHLPAKDIELYAELVERYEQAKKNRDIKSMVQFIHDDGTLITFDEYIQGRETCLSHWKHVYTDMLDITPILLPTMTNKLKHHLKIVQDRIEKTSTNKQHKHKNQNIDNYTEWLVAYYGEQIESTFNQLDFIDNENLPIGLIMLMKTTKIDWNKDLKDFQ